VPTISTPAESILLEKCKLPTWIKAPNHSDGISAGEWNADKGLENKPLLVSTAIKQAYC